MTDLFQIENTYLLNVNIGTHITRNKKLYSKTWFGYIPNKIGLEIFDHKEFHNILKENDYKEISLEDRYKAIELSINIYNGKYLIKIYKNNKFNLKVIRIESDIYIPAVHNMLSNKI